MRHTSACALPSGHNCILATSSWVTWLHLTTEICEWIGPLYSASANLLKHEYNTWKEWWFLLQSIFINCNSLQNELDIIICFSCHLFGLVDFSFSVIFTRLIFPFLSRLIFPFLLNFYSVKSKSDVLLKLLNSNCVLRLPGEHTWGVWQTPLEIITDFRF